MSPLSVRSLSAHERGEVCSRSCTLTPAFDSLPAARLRAVWKAVITRKSLVISWYGYCATIGVNSLVPKSWPIPETSTTTSLPATRFHSASSASRFG